MPGRPSEAFGARELCNEIQLGALFFPWPVISFRGMTTPMLRAPILASFALVGFTLVACSSSSGGNGTPTVCTVEGIWNETEATYVGEVDTFCPKLEDTLKYDLDSHQLTKNDTTYSDRRKSDNGLTAWTETPDSCHLSTKGRKATGKLTIGTKEYTLTFTPEGDAAVTINGATATYVEVANVTASPALDGTPCKLTQTITLARE